MLSLLIPKASDKNPHVSTQRTNLPHHRVTLLEKKKPKHGCDIGNMLGPLVRVGKRDPSPQEGSRDQCVKLSSPSFGKNRLREGLLTKTSAV